VELFWQAARIMSSDGNLLQVNDLKVWFGSRENPVRAVDGVTFSIPNGSTVALVGESGCGKSVTALALAKLVPSPAGFYAGGEVLLDGDDVLKMDEKRLTQLRGALISYVFQEPSTALNPVFRIGYQIGEAVRLHQKNADSTAETMKLMSMVGLPDPEARMQAYPHELSGGMQQRAMIAMALACRPKLLIADEPTTALDVTIQAQILELLKSLQTQLRMSVLLITHNLGLVADSARLVNVMYAGRIVESGSVEDVLSQPAHPYTRGLLDAVPRLESERKKMKGIEGSVPHPGHLPAGCKFWPRCPRMQEVCKGEEPGITEVKGQRSEDRGQKADDGGRKTEKHSVRCYFPIGYREKM
jgi:oligopeptide/dipeptide ABC transporter ATP-binding protein